MGRCIDSGEEHVVFWTYHKVLKWRKNYFPATDHLCAGEQGDEKTWVNDGNIFAQLHTKKSGACWLLLRSDYTGGLLPMDLSKYSLLILWLVLPKFLCFI